MQCSDQFGPLICSSYTLYFPLCPSLVWHSRYIRQLTLKDKWAHTFYKEPDTSFSKDMQSRPIPTHHCQEASYTPVGSVFPAKLLHCVDFLVIPLRSQLCEDQEWR